MLRQSFSFSSIFLYFSINSIFLWFMMNISTFCSEGSRLRIEKLNKRLSFWIDLSAVELTSILFQVVSMTRSLSISKRRFVFSASILISEQTLSPSCMNWSCFWQSITNSSRSNFSIAVTRSFSDSKSLSFF